MANALYPTGLKAILDGDVDFLTDTIKIVLLNSSHSYNSAHDFLDDINANAVATSSALSSKTTTAGAFDAADVTFSALTGAECTAWVLFKDSGVAGTSQLILHMDTEADTSAFSYTPSGVDFTIQFGSGGVFSL